MKPRQDAILAGAAVGLVAATLGIAWFLVQGFVVESRSEPAVPRAGEAPAAAARPADPHAPVAIRPVAPIPAPSIAPRPAAPASTVDPQALAAIERTLDDLAARMDRLERGPAGRRLSDDGVRLWVGSQLVLAEYNDHAPQEDLVEVQLEPGLYPVRVEYYENGGYALMQLLWRKAPGERAPIPPDRLFHTPEQMRQM